MHLVGPSYQSADSARRGEIHDADRFPEMRAKPVTARFALCPWALYQIEVQAVVGRAA